MKVSPATDAEVNAVFKRQQYPEMYEGMKGLEIGQAIKGDCQWSHHKNKNGSEYCNGRVTVKQYAKTLGFSVRQTCANGTFYVQRIK